MAIAFSQPVMLVMGLMGPLLSLGHQAVNRQRQRRAEEDERVQRQHEQEARDVDHSARVARFVGAESERYLAVGQWLLNPLWQAEPDHDRVMIRIGTSRQPLPSELGEGEADGLPVCLPLREGIAVVGNHPAARQVWRAVACQILAVAATSTPRQDLITQWPRDADLPDGISVPDPRAGVSRDASFVSGPSSVPAGIAWVVAVAEDGSATVSQRGRTIHQRIVADQLGFASARWARLRLLGPDQEVSPEEAVRPDDRRALWLQVGSGEKPIDLVAHGPHGLVWGQTGSGKSVAVQAMVVSMARRYSPEQLGFVGIDFKGGAALAPLAVLPHWRGLLTDLHPGRSDRVARSLRAEIRRREETFADAGVSTWADYTGSEDMPRILIVVDEAGVVAEVGPELLSVLSDVATRGRSLGLHLLLSTQRASSLPRHSLAKTACRQCLTVTETDEAASFLPEVPRHLVSRLVESDPGIILGRGPQGTYRLIQVRPVSGGDIQEVCSLWDRGSLRQLWQGELPTRVTAEEISPTPLAPDQYLLGLADDPDRQCQEAFTWVPRRDGPLVVVGEDGSGHTNALMALGEQAHHRSVSVLWLPGRPDLLVHALSTVRARVRERTAIVILLDRLDRVLQGCPPDTAGYVADQLGQLSVELGSGNPLGGLVVSHGTTGGVLTALQRWSATTALLRHRQKETWSLNGGQTALHEHNAEPGRAAIGNMAVQWVVSGSPGEGHLPSGIGDIRGRPEGTPVISAVDLSGVEGVIPAGQTEARWREIQGALATSGIVMVGLEPAVMRQLAGPGVRVPPVVAQPPYGWWATTGGVTLVRVLP